MRYFLFLLLSVALISCDELEISQYEYHTTTQMGRTVTTVTQDSVIVTFNGRGNPTRFARATKPAEWKALGVSMKDVDLAKVPTLEAPSNKRATDAAPFAKFKFTGKDGVITSADFDHKNPNVMLDPLMKEFLKIIEENAK